MIHAIEGGGWDPVPIDVFRSHVNRVSSMKEELWVDTFSNVSKYIRERDEIRLNYNVSGTSVENITLGCGLDTDVFDVPLTLEMEVPSDWIDVDIRIDSNLTTISPELNGSSRRFFMDAPPGSTIAISRNVSAPRLFPEGSGNPFSPDGGNSSTSFMFTIRYISGRMRNVSAGPMLIFDLNGDGDTDDIIGGMTEGSHIMDFANGSLDGGLLYTCEMAFPPGCRDIRFYMEVRDSENLYGRYPDEGFLRGPLVNNPPRSPANLSIDDLHSLHPVLSWDEPFDPDGDEVHVNIRVISGNGTDTLVDRFVEEDLSRLVVNISTDGTGICAEDWFNHNLTLRVRFNDSRGSASSVSKMRFEPRNYPPSPVEGMRVTGNDTTHPVLNFNASTDPDGDDVLYNMTVLGRNEGSLIFREIFSHSTPNTTVNLPDLFTEDHIYRIEMRSVDSYLSASERSYLEFTVDLSPYPVLNITVIDKGDREGEVLLQWDYPLAYSHNISGFEVRVFDRDPNGEDPTAAIRITDVGDAREARLEGLVDGGEYWFTVVPYDGSGNRGEPVTFIRGVPRDIVPPEKVFDLKINLTGSHPLCRLFWEMNFTEDLQGFMIYRTEGNHPDDVGDLEPLHVIQIGNLSSMEWYDATISSNTTYFYTVVSFDRSGNFNTSGLDWVMFNTTIENEINPTDNDQDDSDQGNGSEPTGKGSEEGGIPVYLMVIAILILVAALFLAVWVVFIKRERRDEFLPVEE